MTKLQLDEDVSAIIEDTCNTLNVKLDSSLCLKVLENLKKTYNDQEIREATAKTCRFLLLKYSDKANEFYEKVMDMYTKAYQQSEPKMDNLGRKKINPIKDGTSDLRLTLARILTVSAKAVPVKSVTKLVPFYVPAAVADRNTLVQSCMVEAAIALIDEHGGKKTQFMMATFQTFMTKAPKTPENDIIRKNVIILIGNLARHLNKDDDQVKAIIVQLLEALSTPSQIVQEAVANCFPPLVETYRKDATKIIKDLSKTLYDSTNYGERKGAAYGIAGIVRGLGMPAIRQQTVALKKNIQDSKTNRRVGALIGIEVFVLMLNRLFEPFIVQLLPFLLTCYGDTVTSVRQATEDTSRTIMSRLSATGVRLILPALLKAIDQDAWRTKVGSVQLLASMGNCAPKQLSSCLPSIVPKIIQVLNDSHMKVQEASTSALKQICSVIRNPEIASMSTVLMRALQDPANSTTECLLALSKLEFKHYIDTASLSLIMPVMQRGFKERSSETRKLAAQIIGALYLLTDQRDLDPYLASVIPGIKTSILDPAPDVRSATASAMGAMVRGSGEDVIVELMPWLLETLTCKNSQVDRSGAAQAISEVIGGLGISKLDHFMEQIITTVEKPDLEPHVKDGYLMLFIYFPIVFKQDFVPYIGLIVAPVLRGLTEEVEYVRETALLAGQRIVNMYAGSAIELVLPELETGIFDDNWRIRHSSVQLIGDLLYKISGVSNKAYTDAAGEDEISDDQAEQAIMATLGLERRNRILSGLYMCRSDVSHEVKYAALHIWKMIVSNTPRTLREILPTLFGMLLGCLACSSVEKQQIAARTLGDLVRKLGERVLPEIIPILEEELKSDKVEQRQGVCIGLSEIIASTSRDMVATFTASLVPTVRKALHDPLPEVREAAAKIFDSLHSSVGSRALDEILPHLIKQLNDPVIGEYTLDGIKRMMAIKNRVVLPYILPYLTDHQPVNTKALALIAPVAAEAMTKHLNKVLPAIIITLSKRLDTRDEKQESKNCQAIVLSIVDEQGSITVVEQLLQTSRHSNVLMRRASLVLLNAFCHQSKSLLQNHVSQLLRGLILLYTDSNQVVLQLAFDSLTCLIKSLDLKETVESISDVRNAVRYAISDMKAITNYQKAKGQELLLPGFSTPSGFSPILPIYRETLVNGSPDKKELAASSLCEIIDCSSAVSVEASTMKIGGTVIRILYDSIIKEQLWSVKIALLDTLIKLMVKVGPKMRPFIPQCEQTLRKLLQDYHRGVRLRTVEAMSKLILIIDAKSNKRNEAICKELQLLISQTTQDDYVG